MTACRCSSLPLDSPAFRVQRTVPHRNETTKAQRQSAYTSIALWIKMYTNRAVRPCGLGSNRYASVTGLITSLVFLRILTHHSADAQPLLRRHCRYYNTCTMFNMVESSRMSRKERLGLAAIDAFRKTQQSTLEIT